MHVHVIFNCTIFLSTCACIQSTTCILIIIKFFVNLLQNGVCDVLMEFIFPFLFVSVNETWPHPSRESGTSSDRGRMAHSSVYVPQLNLIFIYGGEYKGRHETSSLVVYDPLTRHWGQLSMGPHPQAFHSMVLVGGALVSFSGYSTNGCYSSKMVSYDIGNFNLECNIEIL